MVCIWSFRILRGFGAKKLFNVPWYYCVMSLDIGGSKGALYRYKGVAGIPDAVFRHPLWPMYIVGEIKGRKFNNECRPHEWNQLMLYVGIVNSTTIGTVRGALHYKDKTIWPPFDKKAFKLMIEQRHHAINILNQLR